jgi:hypothetical protein
MVAWHFGTRERDTYATHTGGEEVEHVRPDCSACDRDGYTA